MSGGRASPDHGRRTSQRDTRVHCTQRRRRGADRRARRWDAAPPPPASADAEEVEYVYLENRIEGYHEGELVGYVEAVGQETLRVYGERCDAYSPHAEVDAEPGTEYWDAEGRNGDRATHDVPRSYHFRLGMAGANHSEWHPIT